MTVEGERSIYLIKHAEPLVQPDVPAEQWTLSQHGAGQARVLATAAAGWQLAAIYASAEPKATSTALIIADALGLQVRALEGIEELRLGGWIANADAFNDAVREILEHPERTVLGAETAAVGAARFSAAVNIIVTGELPAAVVSHGRILTAYLSHSLGRADPFALWRGIPFGGVARLDVGGSRLRLAQSFTDVAPASEDVSA